MPGPAGTCPNPGQESGYSLSQEAICRVRRLTNVRGVGAEALLEEIDAVAAGA